MELGELGGYYWPPFSPRNEPLERLTKKTPCEPLSLTQERGSRPRCLCQYALLTVTIFRQRYHHPAGQSLAQGTQPRSNRARALQSNPDWKRYPAGIFRSPCGIMDRERAGRQCTYPKSIEYDARYPPPSGPLQRCCAWGRDEKYPACCCVRLKKGNNSQNVPLVGS